MIQLLSVHEAARVLSLSSSTLYKYAERKQIGFVKIGSALRFTESHLEAFITARISTPSAVSNERRKS